MDEKKLSYTEVFEYASERIRETSVSVEAFRILATINTDHVTDILASKTRKVLEFLIYFS